MNMLHIAHQRLHNQRLLGTSIENPAEVVRWLVASQAQDFAGAKWALGLRLQGATDDLVEKAFTDGTILRTHLMRPTWHFVTPEDIRWLLALTAPRVHAISASMYRQLELDGTIFNRSHDVLIKALRGNKQLTRDELRVILENAGISTDHNLRTTYIMMHAELEGILCSGARRGKQFTYALLDERAPQAKILNREEALAELAGRYFPSRGPVTVQDFAKWSGLTVADARRGLEAVKTRLEHETLNGQEFWFPSNSFADETHSPTAHLLSIYDEYMSSYKDRGAIHKADIGIQLRAMVNDLGYVAMIDGQIVGTWKRIIQKEGVNIQLNPLTPLAEPANQAIALAAQRYGKFLGLPVTITQ